MFKQRHILIPTDFSSYSQDAIDYGVQLAKALGSEIYLLYVFQEPMFIPSGPTVPMVPEVGNWLDEVQKQERQKLDDIVESLGSQLKKVTPLFKAGNPVLEILKAAKEIPADLIVMGTHGRTGLPHFVIGSVAERVVREGHCPVLTVKPKAFSQ